MIVTRDEVASWCRRIQADILQCATPEFIEFSHRAKHKTHFLERVARKEAAK